MFVCGVMNSVPNKLSVIKKTHQNPTLHEFLTNVCYTWGYVYKNLVSQELWQLADWLSGCSNIFLSRIFFVWHFCLAFSLPFSGIKHRPSGIDRRPIWQMYKS